MTTSTRPLVIYHADADGFGAAWALSKHLGTDIELYRSVYKPIFPDVKGRNVYMVDICFDLDVMQKVNDEANSLLVLDHHAKALKLSKELPCIHHTGDYSACVWAWKWFHKDQEVPWILEYVQDRDLWQWKLQDSQTVNSYFKILPDELGAWDRAAEMTKDEILVAARYIKLTTDNYTKSVVENARFALFEGCLIPKVNIPDWEVSEVLNILAITKLKPGYEMGDRWRDFVDGDDDEGVNPDFALGWYQTADKEIKCNLRSTSNCVTGIAYNVREIAERHGGGGHDKAAGFYTK